MTDLAWKTDLQLACAGDRDAFARLIREMQNEMYGMAKTLLHKDEDCADAIQEAILKAYRSIKRLREPAYFRTWMFRILIHECQQLYRKQKRTSPSDKLPERHAYEAAVDLDLQDAVNRLDESLRTLVKLHYYADLPLSQIAEMLGVSEGTLKSRLHRARKQLASWLSLSEKGGIGYELQ
ncbi:sigma-70 family RNA polymerase sigma factor [Cohnella abietis]|uniref:RNA polymerase sigma factor n=1 Tax=Cohnella abietis TaxID=2507935 RepID=A0A3T1D2J0_9BACL|nr:sigma-70 family RNA polymerase sigma factor [Cohnella abietis]BBI32323.1 RNA polymerase sigma factor [Cohnella abietis]